jgi:ribosome maturation factor RimP
MSAHQIPNTQCRRSVSHPLSFALYGKSKKSNNKKTETINLQEEDDDMAFIENLIKAKGAKKGPSKIVTEPKKPQDLQVEADDVAISKKSKDAEYEGAMAGSGTVADNDDNGVGNAGDVMGLNDLDEMLENIDFESFGLLDENEVDLLDGGDGRASSSVTMKPSDNLEWKEDVEEIVHDEAKKKEMNVQKILWFGDRMEITVSNCIEDYNALEYDTEQVRELHYALYNAFELREHDLNVVNRYEIMLATPGISDVLRADRDFETFRGFPVTVTLSEEYKKKKAHEGTLVGRDEESVKISIKGRNMSIPRALVKEVRLPKSKIEPTDSEMRKLKT